MNLAFEKWIPCLDRGGAAVRASILECFRNQELAGLDVRPHERVAVMRLLECVAYAAAGIPEDYEAWRALPETLAASVERYLEQWRWAFNLMDAEHPFLQVPDLRSGAVSASGGAPGDASALTPVSKLALTLAAGNNCTLFDHAAALPEARRFDEATLALWLLAYQCFCTGGLTGSVLWKGRKTERSSSDCPCACGSMLHTFVCGKTLAETLWLNLITEEDLSDFQRVESHSADRGVREAFSWRGRPVWERFPRGPGDDAAAENATRSFLGRLVPLGRLVRILEDHSHVLVGSFYVFPTFPDFPKEVSASSVLVQKAGKPAREVLLGYQPGQQIWRQLAALSVKRHASSAGAGGCVALNNLPEGEPADIVVCALAHDKARLEDSVESVFKIRPGGEDRWHRLLEQELGVAEHVRMALEEAFTAWRHQVDGGLKGRVKADRKCLGALNAAVAVDFYASAERLLPALMAALDCAVAGRASGELEAWEGEIRRGAEQVLSSRCSRQTPRELMAYVKARAIFLRRTRISKE